MAGSHGGSFSGTVDDDGDTVLGEISDGDVAVEFFTDLSLSDTTTLLESLVWQCARRHGADPYPDLASTLVGETRWGAGRV